MPISWELLWFLTCASFQEAVRVLRVWAPTTKFHGKGFAITAPSFLKTSQRSQCSFTNYWARFRAEMKLLESTVSECKKTFTNMGCYEKGGIVIYFFFFHENCSKFCVCSRPGWIKYLVMRKWSRIHACTGRSHMLRCVKSVVDQTKSLNGVCSHTNGVKGQKLPFKPKLQTSCWV